MFPPRVVVALAALIFFAAGEARGGDVPLPGVGTGVDATMRQQLATAAGGGGTVTVVVETPVRGERLPDAADGSAVVRYVRGEPHIADLRGGGVPDDPGLRRIAIAQAEAAMRAADPQAVGLTFDLRFEAGTWAYLGLANAEAVREYAAAAVERMAEQRRAAGTFDAEAFAFLRETMLSDGIIHQALPKEALAFMGYVAHDPAVGGSGPVGGTLPDVLGTGLDLEYAATARLSRAEEGLLLEIGDVEVDPAQLASVLEALAAGGPKPLTDEEVAEMTEKFEVVQSAEWLLDPADGWPRRAAWRRGVVVDGDPGRVEEAEVVRR